MNLPLLVARNYELGFFSTVFKRQGRESLISWQIDLAAVFQKPRLPAISMAGCLSKIALCLAPGLLVNKSLRGIGPVLFLC